MLRVYEVRLCGYTFGHWSHEASMRIVARNGYHAQRIAAAYLLVQNLTDFYPAVVAILGTL